MTSGLRWMFWFAPLWLVALLPAADWCSQTRFRRGLALVLLGLSVLSAAIRPGIPGRIPGFSTCFLDGGWSHDSPFPFSGPLFGT